MNDILVLFYSRTGATKQLAHWIAQGIERVSGVQARLRTVPSLEAQQQSCEIPEQGVPYASVYDLEECIGLALGSPTRFGTMAAPLKYFLERTSLQWLSGALVGKAAGVFTASSSLHGGQESTLLSMMLPLLHHGMVMVGIPYTEAALSTTQTGGTPYGASRVVSGEEKATMMSAEERTLAQALGQRLAQIALKLST